jgi:O-antigen/teichoic acid export membrane protein
MVLVLLFVPDDSEILRLIVALLISQGIGSCLALVAVATELSRPRRLMSRDEISSFWSYAWRMQVAGLTALVNLEADALVVALLLPVRYVAFYSLGATAATYIRNLPLWLLPPVAIRLFRAMGERGVLGAVDEFRTLHARWMGVIVGYSLVGLVSGGVGLVAWLGTRFWPAAVVCAVLTAGNGVNLMTAVMSNFARAIGRPGLEARYGTLVMGVNIALTIPAGLLFGMYGIVTATAVGQVVGSATFLAMLRSSVSASLGRLFAGLDVGRATLSFIVATAIQRVVLATLRGAGLPGLLASAFGAAAGLGVLVTASNRRELSMLTRSAG